MLSGQLALGLGAPESDGDAAGADGAVPVSVGLPDGAAALGATEGTTTGDGVTAGVQAIRPATRLAATTVLAMALRNMTTSRSQGFRGPLP
jgi:hypothetical protein